MKGPITGSRSKERRQAMAKTEGERKVYLAEVIETGDEGAPTRIRITGEAPDDVAGQVYKWGISQDEGDVEGQGYRWNLGQDERDVDGQTWKYGGLGRTEQDVEGQGYRWLRPEGDDTEGEGWKWGGFFPTEEDASGQVLVIAEGVPAAGDIVGRTFGVEDDTEGQLSRWGVGQTEEDVEGQGHKR
jgi:hypothetical protein